MSRTTMYGPALRASNSGAVPLLATLAALILLSALAPAQKRYERFLEFQVRISNALSSVTADINSDGHLDMVLSMQLAKAVLILGDGRGGWRHDPRLLMPPSEMKVPQRPRYTTVAAGDIDGDGDLDLAIGTVAAAPSPTGYPDRIFLGDGKGNFVDGTKGRLPQNKDITSDVQFIDIDRDGDLDLLCAGAIGTSRLYINNGKGYFSDETKKRLPKSIVLLSASNFAAGDLDGDGDDDLVVAGGGFWSGNVSQTNVALRNNGKGYFSLLPVPFPGLNTGWVALGDIDNDGDLDIVTANWGPDGLLLNDGKGRFVDVTAKRMPKEKKGGSYWLHDWVGLDDVDGDGDLDLIFTGYHKQPLVWHPNDGTAHFSTKTGEVIDLSFGYKGTLVDLDRDGDREINFAGYIYYNLQKQLFLHPRDLTRGKATTYWIYASFGPRVIFPYIALKERRIPFLPWGTFFLDPSAMLSMGAVLLMKGGRATLPLLIPNDPLLAGKKVYLQGLVFDVKTASFLGFTNQTANTIR